MSTMVRLSITPTVEPPLDDKKLGKVLQWLAATNPGDTTPLSRIKGLDLAEAAPLLPQMVDHENKYIRLGAIRALGMLRDKTAAPLLTPLQDNPDSLIRLEAMRALALMGLPEPLERLRQMLDDADPNARTGATIALAALNDSEVTRDLLRMFDDADQSVRIRAIDALSTLKDPQVSDALIEALHTSDPRVVLAALKRLTFRGEPAVVDALADLFHKHPDPEMRVECIHAMRARYSEKAHAARLAAFRDPNSNVRANAPRWVPRLSDNEGRRDFIEPLIQLAISDRETEVRLKAVDALGEMAEIAGLETLLEALADQEPPVRMAAVNALGRLGDPRAIQPLVRLFDVAHGPAYDEYYWVGLDRPERYEAPPSHWPRLDIISALKRIATPESLEAADDLRAKLGGGTTGKPPGSA